MPRSVTQPQNARSLYNLLGYYPEWYKSAEVSVVFAWNAEVKSLNSHIIIPTFTQICDSDKKYIYTTIEDADVTLDGKVSSQFIRAIEGSCQDLLINGNNEITLAQLDSNNRVYIDTYNVAYNGIFISGGTLLNGYWNRVDNINIKNM